MNNKKQKNNDNKRRRLTPLEKWYIFLIGLVTGVIILGIHFLFRSSLQAEAYVRETIVGTREISNGISMTVIQTTEATYTTEVTTTDVTTTEITTTEVTTIEETTTEEIVVIEEIVSIDEEEVDVIEEVNEGSILTQTAGRVPGPSGSETWYNLDMDQVIEIMRNNYGIDYEYWVRADGVKMYGEYIMCAANLDIRPKGTLVETSLGTAIVCDTGHFASDDPWQVDIAVNW